MIAQKQLKFGKDDGDCYRACLMSILELPNGDHWPNIDDPDWHNKWSKRLWEFGLSIEYDAKRIWRSGYWIASIKSKNLPKPYTHAIVMKGQEVAFDPSMLKRYRTGRNLLGNKLVHGGHYLVVADASKFYKLQEYRNAQT